MKFISKKSGGERDVHPGRHACTALGSYLRLQDVRCLDSRLRARIVDDFVAMSNHKRSQAREIS